MNRNFFNDSPADSARSAEAPALPAELLPLADAIAAHLAQPMAWLIPLNTAPAHPWSSRIGGWPYLPRGEANPLLDEHAEHRYNLLMQVNLAELPAPLPHFPTSGLLQIFTAEFDDVLDEIASAVRCRYYPTVATDPAALETDFAAWPPTDLPGYTDVPPEGLAVAWQLRTRNHIEPGDDNGGLAPLLAATEPDEDDREELGEVLDEYLEEYNATLPDTDDAWAAEISAQYARTADGEPSFTSPLDYLSFSTPDHQVGGVVPQFWQGDPRPIMGQPIPSQLLIAYDARGNCTERAVPFLGDDAKVFFFIAPEDLAARDFSRVRYCYMA